MAARSQKSHWKTASPRANLLLGLINVTWLLPSSIMLWQLPKLEGLPVFFYSSEKSKCLKAESDKIVKKILTFFIIIMHTYIYVYIFEGNVPQMHLCKSYIYIHAFTRPECLSEDDCKPCRQLSRVTCV